MTTTTRPTARRRAVVSAALACAVAIAAGCAPADARVWKTFAPEGGGFSVSMPGTPERRHDFAQHDSGTIETNVYTLLLPEGGFYTVADAALPPGVDTKGGAEAVLDSACDRIVDSASARLVTKQTIFLNGRPGRQLEAVVPESAVAGGGTMRGRVYLVGPKLYQLIAVVPKPATTTGAVDRFLDSFVLKEP
jgi:hypothetical protein